MTRLERWLSKVDTSGKHWMWTAGKTIAGYGSFAWECSRRDGSRRTTAHRAGYRLLVGEIPEGYEVDHLCRVIACVRPSHLRAIPASQNHRENHAPRGAASPSGRKTHCPLGHPYTAANTYALPSRQHRACRECRRIRDRKLKWERRHPGEVYVDIPRGTGRPRVAVTF